MSEESIVDASRPNAGRMYDYYLGGNHNFEVDRQAAEQALKLMPFGRKYVRLQRWALQDIATELAEKRGFDIIIDFASGLPTNDHIHYKVPNGTTVIYSDFDPITVQYSREILGDTPNVYFFENDATQPEKLLNRPEVQERLSSKRKVALVLWGVSGFIKDEGLKHALNYLYEWAAPGTCLAFNGQVISRDDPAAQKVMAIYKQTGSPIYPRTAAEYEEMVKPWKPDSMGFVPLLEWHGFDESELDEDGATGFGPMGGAVGAYLIK